MTVNAPSLGTESAVAPDAVLSAVANEQRRAVLRVLDDSDEEGLTFQTLVDRVADHVRADDVESIPETHRQRVRTALYHSHLPKLEACGMVVHETDTNRVKNTTGELGRELLTVVEPHETHD
jgi:DNA-binding transcriptional ArsR family regulator